MEWSPERGREVEEMLHRLSRSSLDCAAELSEMTGRGDALDALLLDVAGLLRDTAGRWEVIASYIAELHRRLA